MILPDFEPKFQHRYQLIVQGLPAWQIKATARPTFMLNKITVDYQNQKKHYNTGKMQWSDIPITLRDAINPSAAQAVMAWIRFHHESATGRAGYASMYKRDMQIQVLGNSGQVVQLWDLYGCFINGSVDFGNLDWSAQQPQQISFNISIDRAELQY